MFEITGGILLAVVSFYIILYTLVVILAIIMEPKIMWDFFWENFPVLAWIFTIVVGILTIMLLGLLGMYISYLF